MTTFREDPENTLKEFQSFKDKVACCVSLEDIDKKATSLKVKNEWLDYNRKLLIASLNQSISEIYEGTDLEKKLSNLNKLDKENRIEAWRPQTGKPDLSSIEGKHLERKKKLMKKNITQMKNQSTLLKSEISDLRNQIQEQQIQIEEFFSLNLQKLSKRKDATYIKD